LRRWGASINSAYRESAEEMLELSLHIMDLVQNSLTAGATRVEIRIEESLKEDRLAIEIQDNGRGIPKEMVSRVTDPFVTSRTTRPVGLGLSLFKEAADRCGGGMEIHSEMGRGTRVGVWFQLDHFDRAPLGNIGETMGVLITGNPGVDFVYEHGVDGKRYRLETPAMKEILGSVPLDDPAVLGFVRRDIEEGLRNIGAGTFPNVSRLLQ
jgi:anti-sigma regulatory factor (Ser/Thr protein kinase)